MNTARAVLTWLWECPMCGATSAAFTVPTSDQCAECGAACLIQEEHQQ